MEPEKIDELRNLQNLLGGYSDFTLDQFRMLPYLIFLDIKNYNIELTDENITVTLIPYTGIKGWYLRWRYKKKDAQRAKILAQYLLFWAPKGKTKPRVIIKWQTK